jgi:hypothetical protein
MSLSLAITLNVIADLVLIGALAYVMSRTASLTPHVAVAQAEPTVAPVAPQRRTRREPHQAARVASAHA